MKILMIKLGAIGDVLRTTSFLKGLKEKYKAEIDWLTKEESLDILKDNNLINEIFSIDKDKIIEKYDLIINLDDDIEACKLATNLKKDKIIGAHLKDNKIVYTDDSSEWFNLSLISKFGKKRADELKKINKRSYQEIISKILDIPFTEPILNLPEPDLRFAEEFKKKNNIKDTDLVIGINTGAGKRWEKKKWPIAYTAKLIDKLNNELNAKIILFGGQQEIERNKEIKKQLKTDIIDAGCNNSLMQFAALINLCKILVTSDSLAMHIAIALKKEVVTFFTVSSTAEIEGYGRMIKVTPPLDCICCYRRQCDKKPSCSELISVDMILKATRKALCNINH